MIKFWAWVYRRTGWYSPFAELAEYRMLKKNFQTLLDRAESDDDVSLLTHIRIEIGYWQAQTGFYRKWKPDAAQNRLKRFKKKKGL